jgi:hypothetical protein
MGSRRMTTPAVPKLTPDIKVSISGADDTAKRFERIGKDTAHKGLALTRHYGARLQASVRAFARSSMNITDYDASIRLRIFTGRDGDPIAEVFTRDPQGHRLEYGFVGTDRAGRSYQQAPRPHFRPAMAIIGPAYARAVKALPGRR